jgi:hypothetical protein
MSNKEEEKMRRLKMLVVLTGVVIFAGMFTGCGQPVNLQGEPTAAPEGEIIEDIVDPELPIDIDLGNIDIGFGSPNLTVVDWEELKAGLIENE